MPRLGLVDVEPEVGIAPFERPRPERLDLLVELAEIRETSEREFRSPNDSTGWSTLRVETPQT